MHAGAEPRERASLGAASLATIMQMVACGYGVTLVPEVAISSVELRRRYASSCCGLPNHSRAALWGWSGDEPRAARA